MHSHAAEDQLWEEARRAVMRRWQRALDCVAAHDESGTLAVANAMDELCREAVRARTLATGDPASAGLPCRYCRESLRNDGCLGLVGALNHMVLNGHWDEARRLVHERLRELDAPVLD